MGGLSKSKSCLQLSGDGHVQREERGRIGIAKTGTTSLLGQSIAEEDARRHSARFGELVPTALYLPPVHEGEGGEDGRNNGGSRSNGKRERLYLPRRRDSAPGSLDEYLRTHVPRVASRAEDLQNSNDHEELACGGSLAAAAEAEGFVPLKKRSSSFLNVLQGEVAHATADQADVVISAEATTCHVVALRSTSGKSLSRSLPSGGSGIGAAISSARSAEPQPLVSMAHVDAAGEYDACLEAMVEEHIDHHEKARTDAKARRRRQKGQRQQQGQKESVAEDEYGFFFGGDSFDDRISPNQMPPAVASKEMHSSSPSLLPSEAALLGSKSRPSPPSFLPGLKASESSTSTASPASFLPRLAESATSTIFQEHDEDEPDEPIEMELHMAGGYLDKDGLSQDISSSLITTFSDVAEKYQDKVRISLSSAAISSMNTTHAKHETPTAAQAAIREIALEPKGSPSSAPRSRGLGIDTRTGRVFPVRSSLPSHLEGPAVDVRSARTFAQQDSPEPQDAPPELGAGTEHNTGGMRKSRSLAVIHDASSRRGEIRVEPFRYQPNPQLDVLLRVPDEVLLQVASTSPECESDNFCRSLRRTVSFVNTVPQDRVFESCQRERGKMKPLVYTRSAANLNRWERVTSSSAPAY